MKLFFSFIDHARATATVYALYTHLKERVCCHRIPDLHLPFWLQVFDIFIIRTLLIFLETYTLGRNMYKGTFWKDTTSVKAFVPFFESDSMMELLKSFKVNMHFGSTSFNKMWN